MLTQRQRKENGRASWPTAAKNIPFVGSFHERVARSMFGVDGDQGEMDSDLLVYDPNHSVDISVEVKSDGGAHGGVRAPFDQFQNLSEGVGFHIDRLAYAIFAWDSREYHSHNRTHTSRLSRCRDAQDMWSVLIAHTKHLFIIDSNVVQHLKKNNGIDQGKLVNPTEKFIFLRRRMLQGLVKNPIQTLKTLGLKTRKWELTSGNFGMSFRTDQLNLGLNQEMAFSVTEIHSVDKCPLTSLIKSNPPVVDLSTSITRA